MSLVKAMEWRYATKKYDTSRQLSQQQFEDLLSAVQLAPSSYGLQPYRFISVEDSGKLEQISRAAFGQPQITTASKLLVVAVETNISDLTVKNYIDKAAVARSTDRKNLEPREQFVNSRLALLSPDQKIEWAEKQAFLAVGILVSAAAEAGIDASPMEGFDPDQVDEILGLKNQDLKSVLLFALGYRSSEDEFSVIPKVRKTREELFPAF
ncbi:NAD(P)H-dependent oxidoreductase [Dyadobacter subterraneus]|uniref:NAD(P)H-dependent oxidoreductase n=1 Tax=Dyadobacter subterraneus TaxID=2773304 RepID=A0ABR9WB39_9BACT|nr:NAD(P)H-dependent oxidoreductase [Dyadobacter subterraneus]MBE9462704.1 NAD(P)H-dependent oxidoreductase [Dyadobacter subterraneus]